MVNGGLGLNRSEEKQYRGVLELLVRMPWNKFKVNCGTTWNTIVLAVVKYTYDCDIRSFQIKNQWYRWWREKHHC